jgi:hypothetical protein
MRPFCLPRNHSLEVKRPERETDTTASCIDVEEAWRDEHLQYTLMGKKD